MTLTQWPLNVAVTWWPSNVFVHHVDTETDWCFFRWSSSWLSFDIVGILSCAIVNILSCAAVRILLCAVVRVLSCAIVRGLARVLFPVATLDTRAKYNSRFDVHQSAAWPWPAVWPWPPFDHESVHQVDGECDEDDCSDDKTDDQTEHDLGGCVRGKFYLGGWNKEILLQMVGLTLSCLCLH